jgi:pSer/pThr/pTyr-binding forkhead associated (FHA) protein
MNLSGVSLGPRGQNKLSTVLEGTERPSEAPWAHPPPQDESDDGTERGMPRWRLVEIKDGVQVAEHDLHKSSTTILGRAEGAVDALLLHGSVSRFHARIAFDASGTAWLRDYNSAHGTYVNKKRVPAEACGKEESNSSAKGSRGVVIRPGDVVQLGASTRLLLLEGPSPEQVKKVVALDARRRQPQPPEKLQQSAIKETDNRAGSDFEDETEADRSPEDILSLTEDEIPPAHRKLFEKIRALHQKIENMTTEVERIQRKGDVGLSAGQEKQIQRNEERIAQIQAELETRSDELWQHVRSQSQSSKNSKSRRRSSDGAEQGNDDDEVEDRTADRNTSVVDFDTEGETEASLLRKYDVLMGRSRQVNADLVELEQRVQAGKERIERLNEQGNVEDAFYATNDLDLAMEQLQKVKRDNESVSAALKDVRRMLKVVKPSWNDEEKEENVGDDSTATSDRNVMLPPPPPPAPAPIRRDTSQECISPLFRNSSHMDSSDEFVVPMPPPAVARSTSPDTIETNQHQPHLPPPSLPPTSKRRRVVGPSLPSHGPLNHNTENGIVSSSFDEGSHERTRTTKQPATKSSSNSTRTASSSVVGTLSFLTSDSHAGSSSGKASRNKSNPKPTTPAPSHAPSTNDPQQDVWQPPKDQDGSGSTKLNAKFAGRY